MPQVTGDLQSTGALELAFLADPTTTSPRSGDWWSSSDGYRNAPDVALNHPTRWDTFQSSGMPTHTCLPSATGGNSLSCVEFQEPPNFEDCEDLGCIWTNNFLKMRGFFVTNPESPTGPQINTTVAGTQLDLQVRVYNYSLTNMPAGSEVRVRFYAQPWDHRRNVANGPSFLIDEVTHGTIARFNTLSLNWDLVGTTFDTTGLDDQFLIFWVVVWMQDENGNLVEEVEGHGLTAVPGELADISDVPFEDRSNNVGFYNSVFLVLPSDEFESQVRLSGLEPSEGRLVLEDVRLDPERVRVHQQVDVSASVRAEGEEAEATFVTFHAGNPDDGAEVFDIEQMPLIRAGDYQQARVGYRPRTCGTHELWVTVYNSADSFVDTPSRSVLLEVDCTRPPAPDQDDDGCAVGDQGPSTPAWLVLFCGLAALALRRHRGRPIGAARQAGWRPVRRVHPGTNRRHR